MLEEVLVGRGALWSWQDFSPEWRTASGASGGRRGRRCGSPQGETSTRLDAEGCGKYGSVNEETRGGLVYLGVVVGEETGGGAVRASPSQSSGAPAVE